MSGADDTAALVARLSAQAGPPPGGGLRALRGTIVVAAIAAAALAAALSAAGFGWRPDMPGALAIPAVALKFAWAGGLALAGVALLARAVEPGRRAWSAAAFAPAAAVAAAGLWLWAREAGPTPDFASPPACVAAIATLSLPGLALGFAVLRRGAPVNPRAAGAAAGLTAGAGAAFGYALYCPVDAAGFVLVWYGAGVALAAALGAVAGPRAAAW
jgi:hypothetical protein